MLTKTTTIGLSSHSTFMDLAIAQAQKSYDEGGIPIGSVLVHDSKVIGQGHNLRAQTGSPVFHGEMSALQDAGRLPAQIYRESILYTTLSPCSMCTGAILLYEIPHVVIGENQTFKGEENLLSSKGVEVTNLNNQTCIDLMQAFIKDNPQIWNEDIGEL